MRCRLDFVDFTRPWRDSIKVRCSNPHFLVSLHGFPGVSQQQPANTPGQPPAAAVQVPAAVHVPAQDQDQDPHHRPGNRNQHGGSFLSGPSCRQRGGGNRNHPYNNYNSNNNDNSNRDGSHSRGGGNNGSHVGSNSSRRRSRRNRSRRQTPIQARMDNLAPPLPPPVTVAVPGSTPQPPSAGEPSERTRERWEVLGSVPFC